MSAEVWTALAKRAAEAGADLVQFEVNLDRFLAGPQPGVGLERSWCARTGKRGFVGTGGKPGKDDEEIAVRFGRTGEEAFRSVVDATEKRK